VKKLLVLFFTGWLILSIHGITKAESEYDKTHDGIKEEHIGEYQKVFFEYRKEAYTDNYGPKIGFNWGINEKWAVFTCYEYNGFNENDTYLEAQYQFVKNYKLGFFSEAIDFRDSGGVYLYTGRNITDKLWVDGRLLYGAYYPKGSQASNPNYFEWELSGGLRYQFNKNWTGVANCYLTDTSLDESLPVGDYSMDLETMAGLEWQVDKSLRLSGKYDIEKIDYNSSSIADTGNDKCTIGGIYNIHKWDVYLWYDIPAVRENTVIMGVSYTF
jgi:hypothetical protein